MAAIAFTSSSENFNSALVITLKFPNAAYLARDVIGEFLRMMTKCTLSGTVSAISCP